MIPDNFIFVEGPSYKFNKELDSKIKNCSFCSVCDEKGKRISGEYGLKILCYYFTRNLGIIKDEYSASTTKKNKLCNDLIYWLHKNLKNNHSEMEKDYNEILTEFKEVWKSIISDPPISEDNLCGNTFKDISSFEKFENLKKISDYCENYEFIKAKLDNPNEPCAVYYKYLTNNSTMYTNRVSKCSENGNNYCLNYNNCNTYDPKILLDKPKCKIAKESEDARSQMKEKEEEYTQCGPEYECVPKNYFDTSINYSDYRIVPLIVLSIWGTFLSLYFLYKLSPFRSWLNNHLYKKNIIKKKLHNEEFQELLESDSEDAHINFNNREYHITYNRE
ncbi:PIR Superfamily Protein [Plasmodium ovale wallikeri]|uniref:PIR Superfamily Protein n=1 Tax=Plasmodium ovale wallikeri TaxID=864142 RepID=A0A1A9APC2_PLAOA|nr:PIR Superfamily Protein [Plasmodium ovale wallikeri]